LLFVPVSFSVALLLPILETTIRFFGPTLPVFFENSYCNEMDKKG